MLYATAFQVYSFPTLCLFSICPPPQFHLFPLHWTSSLICCSYSTFQTLAPVDLPNYLVIHALSSTTNSFPFYFPIPLSVTSFLYSSPLPFSVALLLPHHPCPLFNKTNPFNSKIILLGHLHLSNASKYL